MITSATKSCVTLLVALLAATPASAAKPDTGKGDAKDAKAAKAAAGTAPAKPQNPFDESPVDYPTKGELPNLQRLDFAQMGKLLYNHLLADADPGRNALIMEAALQRAGKDCRQVNAYQIYRYRTGSRTLKVKCPGKPLFVLTVSTAGGFQISGGDGTIPELQNTDGRIYSIYGREIKIPTKPISAPLTSPVAASQPVVPPSQAAAPAAPEKAPESKAPEPEASEPKADAGPQSLTVAPPLENEPIPAAAAPDSDKQRFRSWLLIINGTGLGLLVLATWAYLRARRKRRDVLDWDISSDDKDMLLDESREIYPNIFQHPQGFFISRGRRGKRRLFRSALPAMLYRDFGLKLGEIRV